MSTVHEILVPASEGRGVTIDRGQILDVVDPEGQQVGDLVAWVREDLTEYLSPAHTVSCNQSIKLAVGNQLFSNRRTPLFTILRDDVGKHDILVPCCDHERYARDYDLHDHRHCLGNLIQGRDLMGLHFDIHGENAWNVFMHNRVTEDGKVVTDPAEHGPDSVISLRAEADLIVILSACPQDLTPCNNFDPTSMLLRVRDAD